MRISQLMGLSGTVGNPALEESAAAVFEWRGDAEYCERTIRDFYSKELDKLRIPEEINDYGTVQRTRVELRGICVSCRKETKS